MAAVETLRRGFLALSNELLATQVNLETIENNQLWAREFTLEALKRAQGKDNIFDGALTKIGLMLPEIEIAAEKYKREQRADALKRLQEVGTQFMTWLEDALWELELAAHYVDNEFANLDERLFSRPVA